eukprot:6176073-Pleurochrysis_carterae.AAC.1
MQPDGSRVKGKGFMELPCERRVHWARPNVLVMHEKYFINLGGDNHGEACTGARRDSPSQEQPLQDVLRTKKNCLHSAVSHLFLCSVVHLMLSSEGRYCAEQRVAVLSLTLS